MKWLSVSSLARNPFAGEPRSGRRNLREREAWVKGFSSQIAEIFRLNPQRNGAIGTRPSLGREPT